MLNYIFALPSTELFVGNQVYKWVILVVRHMVSVELEYFYKKQSCRDLKSLQNCSFSNATSLTDEQNSKLFFLTSSIVIVELNYDKNFHSLF